MKGERTKTPEHHLQLLHKQIAHTHTHTRIHTHTPTHPEGSRDPETRGVGGMASLHRSRPQGRPPSPKLPPSHKHPVSIPLETKEAAGSGASVPSLAPPEEPTLSDGPVRTEKGGWRTDGQVGSVPAWRRVVGNVSTEMHYVSLFLLKIYYKKTQLGEGHLPLCAKGWGRGSRGRQQLKGELAGITAGRSRPPFPGCAAAAGLEAGRSRSSAPRSAASGVHCPSAAALPP